MLQLPPGKEASLGEGALRNVMKNMSVLLLLNSLSIRLNGPKLLDWGLSRPYFASALHCSLGDGFSPLEAYPRRMTAGSRGSPGACE